MWECETPTFAKVKLPGNKTVVDNAKGTIIFEKENNIIKRKFCLETGGSFESSENTKGT